MLYIVATPIGNLTDLTHRAQDILGSVDLIACEDTRHTRILLDRYSIKTPTISYHQHSTLQKIDYLLGLLKSGQRIALVTDAGTPGISDPGGILVERVHEFNVEVREPIEVYAIPGPSSVMAALSVSGFPADNFTFLGFLPKKKGRQTLLEAIGSSPLMETVVFFESPQRIHETLKDLERLTLPRLADRKFNKIELCLCRELTKKFEEIWRGDLAAAIEKTQPDQKGEFAVVLHFAK